MAVLALLVIVGVLAAIWKASVPEDAPVAHRYLTKAPSGGATEAAKQQLAEPVAGTVDPNAPPGYGSCIVVSHDPQDVLPTPYDRCTLRWKGVTTVAYIEHVAAGPNSTAFDGLVYGQGISAARVLQPDVCVRQLSDHWWAFMGVDNAQNPCASRFQFVPAP